MVKQAAEHRAINLTSVYTKADDPAGVPVHEHHHLVALQQNRFAAEEVNTPQAIFCMTNGCQSRWPTLAGIWLVVDCQCTSDDVLIQIRPEGQIALLCDAMREQPNLGLRCFISTIAVMTSLDDPFGSGFLPPRGE